jgi:hypothetical protein
MKTYEKYLIENKMSAAKNMTKVLSHFIDISEPFKKATLEALNKAKTKEDIESIKSDVEYFGKKISPKVYKQLMISVLSKSKQMGK